MVYAIKIETGHKGKEMNLDFRGIFAQYRKERAATGVIWSGHKEKKRFDVLCWC